MLVASNEERDLGDNCIKSDNHSFPHRELKFVMLSEADIASGRFSRCADFREIVFGLNECMQLPFRLFCFVKDFYLAVLKWLSWY